MTEESFKALCLSVGISAILYYLFLSHIFPLIRARRHLVERWEQYKGESTHRIDRKTNIEDKRLRSLQKNNRLKTFLANPYPSFKLIEFLFYRSGVFTSIKSHIVAQALGIVFATEFIFAFYKLPLIHSFFLGFFASLLIHFIVLRYKESAWRKSFINIFPISLDIINRGLKSGMTLGRGIAMVSEEVEDPVGREFNYIASQLQLGISPDNALNEASTRIGIDEFRFFALALIIQREMGGSLADILGKLSEVIRERERFRKKVWTLSSESRTTALIVGSLPLFLAIVVEFISPGYTKFFFTDPKGQMMLWLCIGLSITGTIVIIRMMSMEE